MRMHLLTAGAVLSVSLLAATAARSEDGWSTKVPQQGDTISAQLLAQLRPGVSTKADVQALLGEPWRILQFNDCSMSMPGQADETWDYRGKGPKGTYRVHIEFDDANVAHLIAKIPDHAVDGKGTPARVAPGDGKMAMKM